MEAFSRLLRLIKLIRKLFPFVRAKAGRCAHKYLHVFSNSEGGLCTLNMSCLCKNNLCMMFVLRRVDACTHIGPPADDLLDSIECDCN